MAASTTELTFLKAVAELIPDGSRVVVAVSGGGDSVALLHLLHRFAGRRDIRLHVAHLDHCLREDADDDRVFVEGLACEFGLPCTARARDVATLRRTDESPEEAARRVRRAFLEDVRSESSSNLIATGHTLDDQAETVLMRLIRGAGARALAGMSPAGPGPFVRPLLGLERDELRDWLTGHEIAFRDDPSNRDLRFDRNRVRRLVLPFLAETLNPRAARHLVQAAARLRDDAECLDALAEELYLRIAEAGADGRLVMEAAGLGQARTPIASRVARLALVRAGADPRRIAARHIEALVDLARGPAGRRLDLPCRVAARRDGRRRIVLERRDGAPTG